MGKILLFPKKKNRYFCKVSNGAFFYCCQRSYNSISKYKYLPIYIYIGRFFFFDISGPQIRGDEDEQSTKHSLWPRLDDWTHWTLFNRRTRVTMKKIRQIIRLLRISATHPSDLRTRGAPRSAVVCRVQLPLQPRKQT